MTENKQLRAAAERLLANFSDWKYVENDRGYSEDVKAVCGYVLAEHRDDDGEAVTDEWFESVGATWMDSDVQKNALMLRLGPLEMYHFTAYQAVCLYQCDHYEMKTRGEVRRLCAALNIPLTEPKGNTL